MMVILIFFALTFTACDGGSGRGAGNGTGTSGSTNSPDSITYTITGITAAYTGTAPIYPITPLENLKAVLTVTAQYSNGATPAVTDYTLSGTLTIGPSTVTVSYEGKTTAVTVPVIDPAAGTPGFTFIPIYSYQNPENPEITGYRVQKDTVTSGALVIPAAYNGKPVTEIGEDTLYSDIEKGAFSKTSITSVYIPASVTTIGNNAFQNCISLTSVTFAEGSQLKTIAIHAFAECTSLTSAVIPEGVTKIGSSAFWLCTSLASVTIPASVTSIGGGAFSNCTSLANVTIPEGVTSIEDVTFSGCTSLTGITIPASVTSIGGQAFNHCTSFTSVTIPASVTRIEAGAFKSCGSLTSVTCLAATPPELAANINALLLARMTPPFYGAFYETHESLQIKVPAASIDAYKGAVGWSGYAGKIVAIQ